MIRPEFASASTVSPASMRWAASAHSTMGRPMFRALRKKMRAKVAAITQATPAPLMATGACSRPHAPAGAPGPFEGARCLLTRGATAEILRRHNDIPGLYLPGELRVEP